MSLPDWETLTRKIQEAASGGDSASTAHTHSTLAAELVANLRDLGKNPPLEIETKTRHRLTQSGILEAVAEYEMRALGNEIHSGRIESIILAEPGTAKKGTKQKRGRGRHERPYL